MAEDQLTPVDDPNFHDTELWKGDRPTQWWRILPLRKVKIAGTIVGFLLLLCILVYYLLLISYPTPIVFIQSAPYKWPLPPQAFVWEDMARLANLGDESKENHVAFNIQNVKLTAERDKGAQGKPELIGFDKISAHSRLGDAIVVYISMQGIVRDGEPCLVPPGGSPSDETTWWRVSDVLNTIDKKLQLAPEGENKLKHFKLKLVVFDCSRTPFNPYLGWLQNDFSGALSKWWQAADKDSSKNGLSEFALLSAAGPGERSWTSDALQGSVFGHFFYQGLSGAADEGSSFSLFHKSVTLAQLDSYLRNHVSDWVWNNRADRQSPLLLTASDSQKSVKLTTASVSDSYPPVNRAVNVSAPERKELWNSLESLRASALYRFDPLGWRNLEHELLWLDQLAGSGAEYKQIAQSTLIDLQQQLNAIHERESRAKTDPSISTYSGLISGELEVPSQKLKLRSLSLAEYIGTQPAAVVGPGAGVCSNFNVIPIRSSSFACGDF